MALRRPRVAPALALLCLVACSGVGALDAPSSAPGTPSANAAVTEDDDDVAVSPAVANRSPSALLRRAASVVLPPLKIVTIHENPRVTDGGNVDPSNLPYLHRNPAI